jgi:hypothetical protein
MLRCSKKGGLGLKKKSKEATEMGSHDEFDDVTATV